MRILLRFGDAQLLFAEGGEVFAEGVFQALRREGDADVREGGVVLREADIYGREVPRFAFKAVEGRLREGTGDLAGAVGTEIEEDDAVALLYQSYRPAALDDVGGKDELVGDAVFIRLFERICRVLRLYAVAEVSVPDDGGLVEKLLSFGGGVKVLSPLSLKEKVIDAARRIIDTI